MCMSHYKEDYPLRAYEAKIKWLKMSTPLGLHISMCIDIIDYIIAGMRERDCMAVQYGRHVNFTAETCTG